MHWYACSGASENSKVCLAGERRERVYREFEKEIEEIVGDILEDYCKERAIDKMDDVFNQLDQEIIIDIIHKLMRIIFPGYYKERSYRLYNRSSALTVLVEDVMYNLNKQIAIVLKADRLYQNYSAFECETKARQISMSFFKQIPKLRDYIESDLQAAYDGDPAAGSKDEIIFTYPGLLASTIHRIAHELYLLKVPLIPRLMTEYAHGQTGIDMHPGATIGKYFFIDHGTGIVIGETTVIGDNVKIYQGVTLGALSTRGGQRLRNQKRHPTLEDDVTVYAGASILGGDTVIGRGAVIGSNAFVTTSVQAGAKVSIKNQELQYKFGSGTEIQKNELDENDVWYYMI
jgi:serine O-acetyltransferase